MKTFSLLRIFLAAIAIVFVSVVGSARAASTVPQTVITWQASNSYVPPRYAVKALPTLASQVTASVAVFAGGAGTLANLTSQTVYWYLNGTLLGGGVGAESITFSPFGGGTGNQTLEVQIPDYPGGLLIKTVSIPVVQPLVVINIPYPNGDFPENPVTVNALPYFFNVTSSANLSFAWLVNGVAASNAEDPENLEVKLPAGTSAGASFQVSLTVTDPVESTVATDQQGLTYQPLP